MNSLKVCFSSSIEFKLDWFYVDICGVRSCYAELLIEGVVVFSFCWFCAPMFSCIHVVSIVLLNDMVAAKYMILQRFGGMETKVIFSLLLS